MLTPLEKAITPLGHATRIIVLGKYCLAIVLGLLLTNVSFANHRMIALTIDDLPFVGESKNFHLDKIMESLTTYDVPATGFIIAKEVNAKNWPMLEKFRDAGFGLGNHTMTHANLNRMSAKSYIDEIEAADKLLAPVLTKPKYFRYPYLAMAKGAKKDEVVNYLAANHYQIAPITIDSKDFMFNQILLSVPENERRIFLNVLKPCYIDFIWEQTLKAEAMAKGHKQDQAQILLIHANLINAYVLPDIIELYRQNGYEFVSLNYALKTRTEKKAEVAKKTIAKNDWRIENFFAWD